jgi:methylphosphotriester-DNA--protein-cysteine methyltransferase
MGLICGAGSQDTLERVFNETFYLVFETYRRKERMNERSYDLLNPKGGA